MRVLMVAAEAVPFAKTGGLADVTGVLPRFLTEQGHDVRVVMPRYYGVSRDDLVALPQPLGVPMGRLGTQWAGVLEGRLPRTDVPVYFIDHERYFGRASLYTDPVDGHGYADNGERFVFLSRAAIELTRALDWRPDVFHVNDWHTAAIPVLLNTVYGDEAVGSAATLLTIHNMDYQGTFAPGLMEVLGVGWEHFTPSGLEFNGQVNLLKGGLYHATLINAVSHGYAHEIQTPAFGHGLDGVLRDRAADLSGVLNGIDYREWNPAADPYIAAQYGAGEMAGKFACKRALQATMGLPQRDVPIVGMVSRLVHQKGIDVVAAALPRLLELDLQLVVLGTGEAWAHDYLPKVAARHPERFACRIGYDNALAHRIEAGADLFLMPSRFEPCGLNQLYSLVYGTPPIVHAVGGLDDTVENYDADADTGTGFKTWTLDAPALFNTVAWAVRTWHDTPEAFARIVQRGMAQRFSWEDAAHDYGLLYQRAVLQRTGRDLS
ncbi:MAG: glycogen synthase GlgA [Deltaproteobacteria bacterium HGW-Deltaproteobacteria-14]|jgi:starch synthase|nr:MAG: glycogen synthase GlgA [Deltaproteobacteria bacterium HGW-Deltaproteobacteria-14]